MKARRMVFAALAAAAIAWAATRSEAAAARSSEGQSTTATERTPAAGDARSGNGTSRRSKTGARASKQDGVASSKPGTAAPPPGAGSARRTLEEIRIEGEVPAPQVLFVTARDQRRFLESHHRHYLVTSRELAERSTLPAWFAVTRRVPERP